MPSQPVLGSTKFQSTLPRGSDHQSGEKCRAHFFYFNPRSLAGATAYRLSQGKGTGDFNPRSLAGATGHTVTVNNNGSDFNPRSLAGATSEYNHRLFNGNDFNPRSLAGATASTRRSFSAVLISIHAPSRERPPIGKVICLSPVFQSTLPRGSDNRRKPS